MATATMWHMIETGMGLKVPVYLKNIMRLEGYDTPIAIQRMSGNNIEELELFGKTEMLKFIKKWTRNTMTILINIIFVPVNSAFQPDIVKVLLSEIQKFVANKLSLDKMYFI